MISLRVLNLRSVSQIRKFYQLCTWDLCSHLFTQNRVFTQLSLHVWRTPRLSNRSVVLRTYQEECFRLHKAKLIRDWLCQHRIRGQRHVVRKCKALYGQTVQRYQHVDPGVILRLPCVDVVGGLLVVADRRVICLEFVCI